MKDTTSVSCHNRDVSSSVIEAYDRSAAAIQRHAELACDFREAGWVRACETAAEHMAAA